MGWIRTEKKAEASEESIESRKLKYESTLFKIEKRLRGKLKQEAELVKLARAAMKKGNEREYKGFERKIIRLRQTVFPALEVEKHMLEGLLIAVDRQLSIDANAIRSEVKGK